MNFAIQNPKELKTEQEKRKFVRDVDDMYRELDRAAKEFGRNTELDALMHDGHRSKNWLHLFVSDSDAKLQSVTAFNTRAEYVVFHINQILEYLKHESINYI